MGAVAVFLGCGSTRGVGRALVSTALVRGLGRLVAATALGAVALRTWLALVGTASARWAGLGAWLVAFGKAAGLVCRRGGTGFSGFHRLGR